MPRPEHEVERPGQSEVLDQQCVPALVGEQGEAERCRTELCLRRGDPEIAAEGQGQTGLDGRSVDGGDRELVEITDGLVEGLGVHPQRRGRPDRRIVPTGDHRDGGRRLAVIAAQVVAGAEGSPLAGEDHHPDRVVHLDAGTELDQVSLEALGHRVEGVGAVEGDRDDPVVTSFDPVSRAAAEPRRIVCHQASPRGGSSPMIDTRSP